MSTTFRAKITVTEVKRYTYGETITANPVYSGSPEDNSYSSSTPSGKIELHVTNAALIGQINPGDQFYVDFTPVPVEAPVVPEAVEG
jgi:hypothetical protein